MQVKTFIGVTEEERKSPQTLECNLEIKSENSLQCLDKDGKEDYICYALISEKICQFCLGNEFMLIEYLTNQVFKMLRESIPKSFGIKVEFKKHNPDMKSNLHAASCVVSDYAE